MLTLVTGDKVTLAPAAGDAPGTITVRDADGEPTGARVMTVGGDTFVYPESVTPYLAAGALDQRLFNVTDLVANGYDDAHLDSLPLIVTYDGTRAGAATLRKRAGQIDGTTAGARPLTSVNGVAVAADRKEGDALWTALTGQAAGTPGTARAKEPTFRGGVAKVWLDGKAEATLSDSVAQIGAPEVWSGGNTGDGVDVAVLDTGYDPGHPDLGDVVEDSGSFVPGEEVTDRNGHGTHVASTIAGSGAASDGKEKGVAPGVDLHVGKVLNDAGTGYDSWIMAGMEWAARDVHARVISMSLGGNTSADGDTLLARSVNELSEETGALFTIAAGNNGPGPQTVRSPGTADAALTVGAVDADDKIAPFSSRGPRYGDDALKPELTAPGVDILAARSQYATQGSGSYMSLSGTSMATPHVAGVAALVAAAHPDWDGSRIKDALVSTVHGTPDITVDDGGNGRVDAVAATAGTLTATGKVDAGIHPPGTDRGVVESTATWTNTSDTAVTAELSVDAPGVPVGVFSLSDDRVEVPAHGTAEVTVRTDLGKAGGQQRWTGRLTASVDGAVRTRTLLGVSTHDRLVHVRTKVTGRSGEATTGTLTFFRKGDTYASTYLYGDGGADVMLLPGRYTVYADFRVEGTHGASSAGYARMVLPQVEIPADGADLAFDGRKLRQIEAVTPKKTETFTQRLDYYREFDDGTSVVDSQMIGDGYDSMWTAPVAKPRDGEQYLTARWRNQQPLLTVKAGSQDFDDLWVLPGSAKLPEGAYDLDLVHPGDGLPADYEGIDAAGKAAVVRWDSDQESRASQQIRAAQDAGVKLLLFVYDLDGRLRLPVVKSTIEVAGLSRTEGERLIARADAAPHRGLSLRAVSHPDTDYLYDLVRTWKGAVPAKLRYAPEDRQLARVESHFRNPQGREVYEARYDFHPWTPYNLAGPRLSTAGAHRTDYVTADSSFAWSEEAQLYPVVFSASGDVQYRPGTTTDVHWFGTVARPRINNGVQPPARSGDRITVSVPVWGDSGGNHANSNPFGSSSSTATSRLYRGKELLATGSSYLDATVPASKGTYRLRLSATRQATAEFPYSTSTDTEWSFVSAAPREADRAEQLPLIQLDYALPTDEAGRARHDATLRVTPLHLTDSPRVSLRTRKVELSYDDGAHWTTARLKGGAKGSVSTVLKAPRGAQFVTLRVHAQDNRGNTVTQTVVRAAGVTR
ncbi:S8 family serine peptidase [Streptomyces sp. AD681]|uniref:S8 family serine peptidase n=1 Tax=Streptomyces sp. AD681 TaxID=3019069 RepID=UPI0022F15D60|nr:S8 family serine peptidase [Streptomyces sp. AD681]MDA5145659.1 S8 family serine peptidase [Streptomyces sp. AD681]